MEPNELYELIRRNITEIRRHNVNGISHLLESLEAQVEFLYNALLGEARTDALTGLHNKRSLFATLDQIAEHSRRYSEPVTFVFADIDGLKAYNDKYGHLQGDNAIRLVAAALRSSLLRSEDYLARFGGDEFVFILSNTKEDKAQLVVERMRQKIDSLVISPCVNDLVDDGYKRVSVSIGMISEFKYDGDYKEQLDKADRSMYAGKNHRVKESA